MTILELAESLRTKYGSKAIEYAQYYRSMWRPNEDGFRLWDAVVAYLDGN